MRLIAEAAFETDLRQRQVGALDQLLGAGDALVANPVLRREPGAALERAGEMTARKGTGSGQFGHFNGLTKALEDQLLDQAFAPWSQAAGRFLSRFSGRRAGDVLLRMGHDRCPCR